MCFRHQPVDESIQFGVQNALKLIFEHVYFQKFSGGLYHQTLRGQNVDSVQFVGGWTSFTELAIQPFMLRHNTRNWSYVISLPVNIFFYQNAHYRVMSLSHVAHRLH